MNSSNGDYDKEISFLRIMTLFFFYKIEVLSKRTFEY